MTLLRELRMSSSDDLKKYLRMSQECFQILLNLVRPLITKQNTKMRNAISAEERLIGTLRFLATGRNVRIHHRLMLQFFLISSLS